MVTKNEEVDIEVPDEEDLTGLDDATDWKAKADELQKKHREAGIRNRERTRALKERLAELETKSTLPPEPKPDEKLLKKVNSALLRAYGYTDPDEITLLEKWQKDTGKDIEELHTHPSLSKVIKAEIEEMRTGRANAEATKEIQGRGGNMQGDRSKPEYWINKGEMPPATPENRKLTASIIREAARRETGKGAQFYNG